MDRDTALEDYVTDVGDGEDGEISFCESSKEQEMQYDVDKLIGWPGFNVEPPKDYKEESARFRAPPMQLDSKSLNYQSLETMKRSLAPHQQQGYIRGEMQNTNVTVESPDSKDIGEQFPKGDPPPPPGIDESKMDIEKVNVNSLIFKPAPIKNTDNGTPIVETYSSYNELPESDKWTSFTTDHIFFENLPESTGKYENMVGILKKCREARKDIEKLADNSKSTATSSSNKTMHSKS